MIHVFLLMVYLGTGEDRRLISNDMYFRNINDCNYFAKELTKTYGNYNYNDLIDPRDKITAYCTPKYINEGTVRINIY